MLKGWERSWAGLPRLLRFRLRQDRFKLLCWIGGIAAFSIAVAYALDGLFPDAAERQALATTLRNPAMVAIIGPSDALNAYTTGALFGHRMMLFTAIAAAILNILLVAGHTRGDEEDGRTEMLRAAPVGRLAAPGAALIEILLVNALLMLVHSVGLGAIGIESMSYASSLLYGAALGAIGLVFAAVTALFAQLSTSGRGTLTLSLGFLGGCYMLRAMIDTGSPKLAWFIPLSWSYLTDVYHSDRWQPIGLALGLSVLLISAALGLNAIRDIGAGFLPQRGGRTNARRSLLSPLGLALRLQRTTLISWGIAMLAIGLVYGSVFGSLDEFMSGNASLQRLLPRSGAGDLNAQFLSLLTVVIAVISSIPALTGLFRLKSEEHRGMLDNLWSRAVSRRRLFLTYCGIAAAAGILALSLAAVGLYVTQASSTANPFAAGEIFAAALSYIPALLLLIGLGALLIGWLPNLTVLLWLYLVYCFIADYMGDLLSFPDWTKKLTVFGYVPKFPVDTWQWPPLLGLALLAVLFASIGSFGYRRRDMR